MQSLRMVYLASSNYATLTYSHYEPIADHVHAAVYANGARMCVCVFLIAPRLYVSAMDTHVRLLRMKRLRE